MASFAFTLRLREIRRKLFPERSVDLLYYVENLAGHDRLRRKAGFFRKSEFGWVAPLQKSREHLLKQGRARPKVFDENDPE